MHNGRGSEREVLAQFSRLLEETPRSDWLPLTAWKQTLHKNLVYEVRVRDKDGGIPSTVLQEEGIVYIGKQLGKDLQAKKNGSHRLKNFYFQFSEGRQPHSGGKKFRELKKEMPHLEIVEFRYLEFENYALVPSAESVLLKQFFDTHKKLPHLNRNR